MVLPMVVLFILGGLQGGIGWIMVQSGLVPEKYFVGHIELTTHLMAALGLLCYTLWFALRLLIPKRQQVIHPGIQRSLVLIVVLCIVQLIYGGFMAGLKAAITAPTWPDINGQFIPDGIAELSPGIGNIFFNPLTLHFIHRGLAYVLFGLIVFWWFKTSSIKGNKLFQWLRNALLILISSQVILGILTVLNAPINSRLVWLGVTHQFTAMLVLMVLTGLLFVVRKRPSLL